MEVDAVISGETAQLALSAPRNPETTNNRWRLAGRGEGFVLNLFNGLQALASEGTYFIAAQDPSAGLTVSPATGVTFSDTQGLLTIYNTEAQPVVGGQGRHIILDFVSLIVTSGGTATTAEHIAHRIDKGERGSVGTQLIGANINPDIANDAVATIRAGQPTIAGKTNSLRNVGRNVLRAVAPVAGDVYTIKFGTQESPSSALGVNAAGVSLITVHAPPIVIAPGWSYVMNEWAVARSAALLADVVIGYIVR